MSQFAIISNASAHAGTSPDGVGWTNRTPPSFPVAVMAWNGTIYCAVGGSSSSATSPDGVTWTNHVGVLPGSNWQCIAWNGSVFCTLIQTTNSTVAATSPDGITWTTQTTPTNPGQWKGICAKGSLFCAVSSNSNLAITSPDGATWTARTLPYSENWGIIAANSNIFLVTTIAQGGYGANNYSAYSSDGITWTFNSTATSSTWTSLTWNGSIFLMIPDSGGTAQTSPDGINWTTRTLATVSSGLYGHWGGCAWNGSVFCLLVMDAGVYVETSPDGITWTSYQTMPAMDSWTVIASGYNFFGPTLNRLYPDSINVPKRSVDFNGEYFVPNLPPIVKPPITQATKLLGTTSVAQSIPVAVLDIDINT